MQQSLPSTTTGSFAVRALAELSHGLVVAYGTSRRELDRWIALTEVTLIGRASPNFGEAYRTLSRHHAEVTQSPAGLKIRDLGSRFGTCVNGARIDGEVPLYDGDVVTFGRIGMVVASAPLTFVPRAAAPLAFVSWRIQELLDDLAAVARTPHSVALLGPPGVGKQSFARFFAALVSDAPPLVISGDEAMPTPATLDPARPVLVVGVRSQAALAFCEEVLARGAARLVVVASTMSELGVPLARRLDGVTFHVPALAERREDVLPIVRQRLRTLAGRDVDVGPALALSLLRRDPESGVRGLVAWTDRLFYRHEASARERGVLEIDRPLEAEAHAGGVDASARDPRAPRPQIGVSRSGASFRVGTDVVDLEHRKPLVRILARLAAERATNAEGSVDRAELIAAGWPGESILPNPAAHRLHVAISTLRSLGLGEVLVRRAAGYALVGPVELSNADS